MIGAGRARWLFVPCLLWLAAIGTARATPVDIASTYNDNFIVMKSSLTVTDFVSALAGTVTLTVTDLRWGDLLSTLSTSISLFSSQKLQLQGGTIAIFDIGANERFTTSIYAVTNGSKGYGLYSLNVSFKPAASAVPLPMSAWLLLSGAGVLATRIRRIRPAPVPVAA